MENSTSKTIEFDENRVVEPDYDHVANRVMDVFNFFFDDFVEFLNNKTEEQFKKFIMKPVSMHAAFLDRVIPDFACKVLPTLFADTGVIVGSLGMDILQKLEKNEQVTQLSAAVEYPSKIPGGSPMVFVFRMFV